jgi:glutathione S-transferase
MVKEEMRVILYQYPGGEGLCSISPPCVKVELALNLLKLEHQVVNCKSASAVRRVSTTGRLPVLEVDGTRIPDSCAILDELERRFPDGGLSPAEPEVRVRDRLWEHFATDTMYWVGFWFRWVGPDSSRRFFQAYFGRLPWLPRTMVKKIFLPIQRKRIRIVGHGGKTAERIGIEFRRAVRMIEKGLEGGPFLQGRPTPARGDLACAAIVAQCGFRGTMPDEVAYLREHDAVLRHVAAVYEACSTNLPRWMQS